MSLSDKQVSDLGQLMQQMDEQQGFAALHALMEIFGWTGTVMSRGDVESWLNRSMTKEEWQKVVDSKAWYRHIPETMTENSWDAIGYMCTELGIPSGEDN